MSLLLVPLTLIAAPQFAPDGLVQIHNTSGGFSGGLTSGDRFGRAVTSLGDLDGDGIDDLAVCAKRDDDGGTDTGSVYILFLNQDGTVKSDTKISNGNGGLPAGTCQDFDYFG